MIAQTNKPVAIDTRYMIHDVLGQGGMGIVYRATDLLTNSLVALKQVLRHPIQDMFASQSYQTTSQTLNLALAHEFEILASLHHPHIIPVLDYGFDKQKNPYYTMAYLPQAQTLLAAATDQPLLKKVEFVRQMLEALAYLHRRGILHRDLKPENVLVVADMVYVLDFGLAVEKEDARGLVGTWQYSAPEILLEEAVTEASDLYSAGVLAYQVLAEKRPFDIYAEDYI